MNLNMTIINYPRHRASGFVLLGLVVVLFITSFFWVNAIARHYTIGGPPREAFALVLFIGNMLLSSAILLWWTLRFRRRNQDDFSRLVRMRRVLRREIDWLFDNCSPESYTLHQHLSNCFVEFHSEQDRILFELAFKR